MNAKQLCKALEIDAEQLAEWRKLGLPSKKGSRGREFDQAAVAAWLVEKGLAKPKTGVVSRQADVAKHFGVSTKTVQNWQEAGMPFSRGRYDLDAIAEWREARFGKAEDEVESQDPDKRGYWATRREKAAALKLELELAELEGRLVDPAVPTQLFRAHIVEANTLLDQLIDRSSSFLPEGLKPADKRTYNLRITQAVRDIQHALASALTRRAAEARA